MRKEVWDGSGGEVERAKTEKDWRSGSLLFFTGFPSQQ